MIKNIFFSNGNLGLFYGDKVVFQMQIFTFLIGLLTGFELPMLMQLGQGRQTSGFSNSRVLALSYFCALLGALFSAGLIFPKIDFISTGVLIGLISLIAATLLGVMALDKINKMYLILILVPISLAGTVIQLTPQFEQIFLKNYYVNMKIPEFSYYNMKTIYNFFSTLEPIERFTTNYQIIDITPDKLMSQYDQESSFVVYLNNQVQFSRRDYQKYHETMVHGSINIAHKVPENVLILGGGDGLILAELLKLEKIKSITQVELDPQMIELATFHPILREINDSVYSKDRVQIIYEDGFSYLQRNSNKYDAVFIDFPFPTSYDLSKLYSLEFYRILKKSLADNAFFVFDAPIIINPDLIELAQRPTPQDIIISTLKAADFTNIYGYGLSESFYVVSLSTEKLKLDYEKLPNWLKNQTIVNLSVLSHALSSAEVSKNYVNSIFKPQKFIFK